MCTPPGGVQIGQMVASHGQVWTSQILAASWRLRAAASPIPSSPEEENPTHVLEESALASSGADCVPASAWWLASGAR